MVPDKTLPRQTIIGDLQLVEGICDEDAEPCYTID
jgi:hypothetical protein